MSKKKHHMHNHQNNNPSEDATPVEDTVEAPVLVTPEEVVDVVPADVNVVEAVVEAYIPAPEPIQEPSIPEPVAAPTVAQSSLNVIPTIF